MDILMAIILGIPTAILLAAVFAIATDQDEAPEIDDYNRRPKLSGEDLERWTEIYKALSVLYQDTSYGDVEVTNRTWRRWSRLTGKPQWAKVKTNKGE